MNRQIVAIAILVLAALLGGVWFYRSAAAPPAVRPVSTRPDGRTAVVTVAHAVRKAFAHEIEAQGTIRANESVDITAKVAERVAAIKFAEGQQVRKGQVLVVLDSSEARADLAAAQAAERDSRSQYRRSQELFQMHALSEAQLDQLQATMLANAARVVAAQSRVNDRIITAPFGGRVGLRAVSVGGLVNPGAVITTLDDLSVVKLDFSLPELYLATLRPGQKVAARSSTYPDEAFVGRVSSIATRVDPVTRAVDVRALIDNPDGRLRPGMFLTLTVRQSDGDALMVPEQAIVPENNNHFVFVIDGGRAHKRQVTIGRRRPGEVEILKGLTTDENIVVDGTVNVSDGSTVRVQAEAVGDTRAPPPQT